MRWVSVSLIILISCLWVGFAIAQTDSTTTVPYIYRLKIDDCTFAPTARRQTGFRVQGVAGMVTALHGVADCKTVSAVADDGGIFTDLVIAAVDIDHDIALLRSPDLADLSTDGLAVSTLAPTEILTASLRIVGYPLGLDKQDVDSIESVRDIEPLDGVIPDDEESTSFLKRKSPDIDIEVLNLQAQLLPGHSGAPVLDEANGLVAVGDGGLRGGTVGRSWAIPWQAVKFASVDVAEVSKKLAELATKDISTLSFSSTYPGSSDNTESATYMVRVVDADQMPIANAEVLLTHSAGYEIGLTDSEGFYTFHLPTNVSYVQSQIQVEAPGYPLYNRTLSNVLGKVSAEIVRLTALRPTPSLVTSSFCEFAFRILDEASQQPIENANLAVTLGSRLATGKTDSNGFYESNLSCPDPRNASVRVRVDAEGYKQHSETVPLVGEIKEITLGQIVTPTPTHASKPNVTSSTTESLIKLEYGGLEASGWFGSGWEPEKAFDIATSTGWSTLFNNNWLKIYFHETQTISRIRLYRKPNETYSGQIREMILTLPDNTSQTISVKEMGEWQEIDIDPITTQELKLQITKIYPQATYLIVYGLEFFGPKISDGVETATLPQNSKALVKVDQGGLEASGWFGSGWEPEKAFDSDISTGWSTLFNNNWLKVYFPESRTISRIRLYRKPNEAYSGQIREMILTLPDNSRQTVSVKELGGWQEIDIDPVTTQEIKLQATVVYPQGTYMIIYSLEFLGPQ